MGAWLWGIEAVVLLLVLLLAFGACLVVRRRVLARHGGTFELSYRARTVTAGRGWVLGIGRYSGEELQWFRIFSLSPKPRHAWARKTLQYVGRREPEGIETMSLYPGHVVVSCRTPDGDVELAMNHGSLTGFQAWLEAGPPGAEIR
jgi:hypothetical protein